MVRHSDPSGISGVGLVAYGVQFDDGHVAVRWVSESPSTSLWDDVDDLMAVHGHRGATVLHWMDTEPDPVHQHGNGAVTHPREAYGRRPAMSHRPAGRHRAD